MTLVSARNAPAPGQDTDGLGALPGLEHATGQLVGLIAVLQAEQARRQAGIEIRRPAWKNLVFTGGPGTGKSRAAQAIARLYHDLGVLASPDLIEITAADLVGATLHETTTLVTGAVQPLGRVVMITGAHTWHDLADQGRHILRCLYQVLTEARTSFRDELAVILGGQSAPLRVMLHDSPALAARFGAIADFPGYTPAQLSAILTALAGEAGLVLTSDAQTKAAVLLTRAETSRPSGNARLAVQLLTQATTSQAHRLAAIPGPLDPAALTSISAADIPDHLPSHNPPPAEDQRPGQYL